MHFNNREYPWYPKVGYNILGQILVTFQGYLWMVSDDTDIQTNIQRYPRYPQAKISLMVSAFSFNENSQREVWTKKYL